MSGCCVSDCPPVWGERIAAMRQRLIGADRGGWWQLWCGDCWAAAEKGCWQLVAALVGVWGPGAGGAVRGVLRLTGVTGVTARTNASPLEISLKASEPHFWHRAQLPRQSSDTQPPPAPVGPTSQAASATPGACGASEY